MENIDIFQFNQISINKIVALIILGSLIYFTHKLITLIVNKWINKEAQERLLSVYIPITINLLWIFFSLYTIYELTLINPVVFIFIAGLILVATWSYVKDFIQGTLFRVQKGNLIGQQIKMTDVNGKVVKMRSTRIHVQSENGEIIEYPYSKLSNAVIAISSKVEDYKNGTLTILVPYTKEIPQIKEQLRNHLFNIPWIVSNQDIKIEIVNQNSESINFKINFYTLDEKFIPKIKQLIDFIKFE